MESNTVTFELDLDIKNSKLIEKTVSFNDVGYKIIKYDETYVCDNDEELGKYRSVILSEPEGRILCYSPPKTLTPEMFQERNPVLGNDIIVNEVVEGTMISLFWDDRINQWEIATKGAIGGKYWFYRTKYPQIDPSMEQKTFRRMFLDALRIPESGQDLNDLALLHSLPKGNGPDDRLCYNFIMQHPDNPIVLTVDRPRLFIVSVHSIQSTYDRVVFVRPDVYCAWPVWDEFNGIIEFPSENFDRNNGVAGLLSTYCSPTSDPNRVGLMLLNVATGDRACLENASYKVKRELRGNNPNLQYQFLCLKRVDKILDFLDHFPQYKKIFFRFHRQYEEFITQLHQAYVSYFIKKEGRQISKRYFPLIHRLHKEVYVPSLANQKIVMKRPVIRDYIVAMPPSEVIYYLNYTE